MENKDFTISILVKQSPAEVFNTLLNVRAWWSGLYGETFEGNSEKVGDEFSFLAGEGMHYSEQRMVELIPGKKVVWLVTKSNLTFVGKTDEWTGTRISFELSGGEEGTHIVFRHAGLVPAFECYDSCAPAWTQYVQERLTIAIGEHAKEKI